MKNLKPFIFGILAASGALVFELIISDLYLIVSGQNITQNYFDILTPFLIFVVLIEEIFRFAMLSKLYEKENYGFSASIYFGLGFAFIELFFNYLNALLNQSDYFFDLGIVGTIFLHIAITGVIGCLILITQKPIRYRVVGIISTASTLHIAYNLIIIYNLPYLLTWAYIGILFLALFLFGQKISEK